MELTFNLATILLSMSVSLGVGCSTIAIINFFAAIRDGIIDESERNLMGVTYAILRVAMVLILLSLTTLTIIQYVATGIDTFTPVVSTMWLVVLVLYTNAALMTLRIMPSTFGPAIQAGSWYTLGLCMALQSIRVTDLSVWKFLLIYTAIVLLAIVVVNGAMAYLKGHPSAPAK